MIRNNMRWLQWNYAILRHEFQYTLDRHFVCLFIVYIHPIWRLFVSLFFTMYTELTQTTYNSSTHQRCTCHLQLCVYHTIFKHFYSLIKMCNAQSVNIAGYFLSRGSFFFSFHYQDATVKWTDFASQISHITPFAFDLHVCVFLSRLFSNFGWVWLDFISLDSIRPDIATFPVICKMNRNVHNLKRTDK